ncbi:MAG: beta-galactosidase [Clostridiales bacterium]|nr:beta-galactosidase [Clostridiales bacterium]
MQNNIPRSEHPNPQWQRAGWKNLNGTWEFDFDFGLSARDKKLFEKNEKLPLEIVVPFCPESKLSGIAHTDFINGVVYRRKFEISEAEKSGNIFLHFGAVDYTAYVYINGKFVGKHKGGYSSFKFDITNAAVVGENTVFVIAQDDVRSGKQPRGKQSSNFYSIGCDYTRTTGIWQTVWLEFVPKSYIKSAKYYADINACTLTVVGETVGKGKLTIDTSFDGKATGSTEVDCVGGGFTAVVKLTEKHLWELGVGGLYDVSLKFGDDTVSSYFGLRSVALDGMKFKLNDRTVFQRTVLDQGFYRDGIYTAPTDDDLIKDIKLSMDAGFNGARLHQKVFEARFLYHCDRLGYMVWGEEGNWGMNYNDPQATEFFLNEWMEVVERDFNHPALIGWCPFNETWTYVEGRAANTMLSSIYNFTKRIDTTRPVIDTSGGYHFITDIFDVHDYDQNPETFKARYIPLLEKGELYDDKHPRVVHRQEAYGGEAVFVSEYGGIQWNADNSVGWGYGVAPKTEEEFITRYKGLTEALLSNPAILGFCYTQLYDIEQEINGLYTYDRVPKFDMKIFKEINTQKAAIEE